VVADARLRACRRGGVGTIYELSRLVKGVQQ